MNSLDTEGVVHIPFHLMYEEVDLRFGHVTTVLNVASDIDLWVNQADQIITISTLRLEESRTNLRRFAKEFLGWQGDTTGPVENPCAQCIPDCSRWSRGREDPWRNLGRPLMIWAWRTADKEVLIVPGASPCLVSTATKKHGVDSVPHVSQWETVCWTKSNFSQQVVWTNEIARQL